MESGLKKASFNWNIGGKKMNNTFWRGEVWRPLQPKSFDV